MDRPAAAKDKALKIIGSLLVVSCAKMKVWLTKSFGEHKAGLSPPLLRFCWVAGTPPRKGLLKPEGTD